MSDFRKKIDCPTSHALADCLFEPLDGHRGVQIANHLASCDFCAAELEFYRQYPPQPIRRVETPKMPTPLQELAETLLNGETIHIKTLEGLLNKS
jgi:hypothetical protein